MGNEESAKASPHKEHDGIQVEIEPDAWEPFKRAVHKVASSPPKPHKSAAATKDSNKLKRGRSKKV